MYYLCVLRCRWRLIFVIKKILPVGFPVCVDLLHQFLRMVLRDRRDRSLDLLLRVGIGIDVGTVYENCLGGQVSRFRYLFQYPRKDLVYRLCRKPMTEVIAYRGKTRRFLLERIPQEPTVYHI